MNAFKKMQSFLKHRFTEKEIYPSRVEINFMEVLKKIVDSGWIITEIEMK